MNYQENIQLNKAHGEKVSLHDVSCKCVFSIKYMSPNVIISNKQF